MHRLKLVLLSACLFCTAAEAGATWKLQALAMASNALLVEMETAGSKNKSSCQMKTAEVSQASQKLQSLIDQRIEVLKNKKLQVQNLKKSCEVDCTCDIYDYALEKLSTEAGVTSAPVLFSMAQRKSCRERLKDFCKSDLYKYLRI